MGAMTWGEQRWLGRGLSMPLDDDFGDRGAGESADSWFPVIAGHDLDYVDRLVDLGLGLFVSDGPMLIAHGRYGNTKRSVVECGDQRIGVEVRAWICKFLGDRR